MARIGNFDVTLNRSGWFDINAADPRNGQFDKTAVGVEATTIELQPPGIPSASVQGLPYVIQIVEAAGIPSAAVVGAPFVAQIVEPPGIESAQVVGPAEVAIVIQPAGIPSAESVSAGEVAAEVGTPGIPSAGVVNAGELTGNVIPPGIPANDVIAPADVEGRVQPPGIPTPSEVGAGEVAASVEPPGIPSPSEVGAGEVAAAVHPPGIPSDEVVAPAQVTPQPPPTVTRAHGGWPPAPPPPLPTLPQWMLEHQYPWANDTYWPEEDDVSSWESQLDANEPRTHNAGIIDQFAAIETLPEADYLVAGEVKPASPWKWIAIGAAVGIGAMLVMNASKKPTRKRASSRRGR